MDMCAASGANSSSSVQQQFKLLLPIHLLRYFLLLVKSIKMAGHLH